MKIFDDHGPGADEAPEHIKDIVPGPVPLSSVRAGKTVRVSGLPVCSQAASRLCALGLTPGTEFKVVQNLFGPIILEVRGSRLSLGHGMACRLLVSPAKNGAGCDRKGRGRG